MRALARSTIALLLGLCACSGEPAPSGSTSTQAPSAPASASQTLVPSAPPELQSPTLLPSTPETGLAREGASIAIDSEGKHLFVADEDQSALFMIGLPIGEHEPIKKALPGRPAQVVVLGSTIWVTVRALDNGQGALLGFERAPNGPHGELPQDCCIEKARVQLPADAWGIATSPDGRVAAVTSAWTAKVSLVDLGAASVRWTHSVSREPRGVIFTDNESIYVSHLVSGDLTHLKTAPDATPEIIAFPAAPNRAPVAQKLGATLGYSIVANEARDRLFVPRHALGALSERGWFGTEAVDALDVPSKKHIVEPRRYSARASFIEPALEELKNPPEGWLSFTSVRSTVVEKDVRFVQPRAAVYRKSQNTILIASEGDDNLVELDAIRSDPALGLVRYLSAAGGADAPCFAPTGIALSSDERVAYVHCRSTDLIGQVLLPEGDGDYRSPPTPFVRLAPKPDPESYFAQGRRLFYSASDQYVSGGLGCSGCHPDGRDDGHVWHEIHFDSNLAQSGTHFWATAAQARHWAETWSATAVPEHTSKVGLGYARQTPMIVGRVNPKGPYGWLAESPTLEARLRAGFELHHGGEQTPGDPGGFTILRARQIEKFIREGLVPPPRDTSPLTAEEERGRAIFMGEKSACFTCHTPNTDYTNRSAVTLPGYPVAGFAEENAAFKTPSLLFVGGSAPYYHDGRYATLEELIEKNGDQMGKTIYLSKEDKKALVAFLKRL